MTRFTHFIVINPNENVIENAIEIGLFDRCRFKDYSATTLAS